MHEISKIISKFYQVRVAAFDSAYPENRVFTNVGFTVTRNPNAPIFTSTEYPKDIDEKFPIGDIVVQVRATDLDRVSSVFLNIILLQN